MSYFSRCAKCNNEIGHDEFRFVIPFGDEYLCFHCTKKLAPIIDNFIKENN
jgi:hypothetical protein